MGWKNRIPWVAFKHRNYRLLWLGNSFSQFGDHMQQVAQSWLVWSLTGSMTALGFSAFVGIVPRILFGFFGGPFVDNHNRRRLLGATQTIALFIALAFSISVQLRWIYFKLALFFIIALEATQITNQTTRQALLQEIVPRQDIASAVSLNATGNNLARILGPAVGGLLIPITGVAGLMFINSFTFLGILTAVWLMKFDEEINLINQKGKTGFKSDLQEGYRYIWSNKSLRMLIYLGMVSALLIMPFVNLLPAYVDNVLSKGPQFLGLLTTAFGIGAVLGAMNSAYLRSSVGHMVTLLAAIAQGGTLLLFGLSVWPWLSISMMLILGMATIVYNNSVVTAMQLTTEPKYLGRVMSIYLMQKAVIALGTLLLGILAGFLGIGWTFFVSGLLYLILGAGVQSLNGSLRAEALGPAIGRQKAKK